MFKKLIGLVMVLMTVFALMIPAFAAEEIINTVTCMQTDGTQLVYTQHFLQPDDPKVGRLSIRYENGVKYVEDYKVLPYEEWVDGHYNKHCKDNINRIVKVYGSNGTQIYEYSF